MADARALAAELRRALAELPDSCGRCGGDATNPASAFCDDCGEPCSVCGAHNCTSKRCAYNDEDRDQ